MSTLQLPEPSTHSYLGRTLEDVHQRVYCEQNETLSIPIIYLDNIVLFPSETIPLRVKDSNLASFLQTHQRSQGPSSSTPILIGIIGKFYEPYHGRRGYATKTPMIGTVAEATATAFEEGEAVLMAKGRYRFSLIPVPDDNTRGLRGEQPARPPRFREHSVGDVRLHEVLLLEGEEAYSRSSSSTSPSAHRLHPRATPRSLCAASSGVPCLDDVRDFYSRGMNQIPSWVYRAHSLPSLCVEVQHAQHLLQSQEAKSNQDTVAAKGSACHCPITFSYRVAAQLIVSDEERQALLEASPVLRLRLILKYFLTKLRESSSVRCHEEDGNGNVEEGRLWESLGRASGGQDIRSGSYEDGEGGGVINSDRSTFDLAPCPTVAPFLPSSSSSSSAASSASLWMTPAGGGQVRVLLCEACDAPLAKEADVFQVPGAEGTIGAYVNPHGVIHQTLTISKMLGSGVIRLSGRPSAEDSWFPGYCWTIAYCAACYAHLGWRFTLEGLGGSDAGDSMQYEEMDTNSDDWSDADSGGNNETESDSGDEEDEDDDHDDEDDVARGGGGGGSDSDDRSEEGGCATGGVVGGGMMVMVQATGDDAQAQEATAHNNSIAIDNVTTAENYVMSTGKENKGSSNNGPSVCFWGVRRSGVKVGHLSQDELNGVISRSSDDGRTDSREEAEVERCMFMYCEQWGLSGQLSASQREAMRAQLRQLVWAQGRQQS